MKLSDKTNKSQNVTEERLHSFLLTSFLCVIAAIIVLCGATFAWFQSARVGMAAPIISANYDILSSVSGVTGENNSYTISGGTEYTVTVGATGNASTGFFILTVSYTDTSNTLHTNTYTSGQLAPGGLVTFSIKSDYAANITISAQWGTSSKSEAPDIKGGALITVGTEESGSGTTTAPVAATTTAPAAETTTAPVAETTTAPAAETTTASAAATTTAPAAATTTTPAAATTTTPAAETTAPVAATTTA